MISRREEIRYLRGMAAKLRYLAESEPSPLSATLLGLADEAERFADVLEASIVDDEDGHPEG